VHEILFVSISVSLSLHGSLESHGPSSAKGSSKVHGAVYCRNDTGCAFPRSSRTYGAKFDRPGLWQSTSHTVDLEDGIVQRVSVVSPPFSMATPVPNLTDAVQKRVSRRIVECLEA
jgi:hypothetical protein